MNYINYRNQIINNSAVDINAIEIAKARINNLSEETIKRFFIQYCEVTGYNKPEDFESERENTINGIIDVEAALYLAMKDNDVRTLNINRHQHDLWSFHRINEGWNYGDIKDKANKLNPCLKPFDLLTVEEISWDNMFLNLYEKIIM